MKWVIVVVLVSGIYETSGGGGLLRTGQEFEKLEDCSRQASVYINDWREKYEMLKDVKKEHEKRILSEIQENYSEQKIKQIETLARDKKIRKEDMPEHLRELGEDELAKKVEEINLIDKWRPEKQKRLVVDAEAVCVPLPN
ncbi:MAG: hypothetical protein RIE06_22950 [Roseibium album]|uniref:hypothetical protein n=1 Tax=Roseibium album TaxID=311410 RepID=UPI0032ED63B4